MEFDYVIHNEEDIQITEVTADLTINSTQLFLDVIMNQPSDRIIIHKQNLDESFFDLRSGLAGEILQKVANYRMRLAIVGEFDGYESESLKAFILESNRSNTVAFVNSKEDALARLRI